jgi:hypothetical protein
MNILIWVYNILSCSLLTDLALRVCARMYSIPACIGINTRIMIRAYIVFYSALIQRCFSNFRSGGTLLKIKWAWSLDWAWPMAMKLNKRGFSLIDMLVKICHILYSSQTNNIIIYLIIIYYILLMNPGEKLICNFNYCLM